MKPNCDHDCNGVGWTAEPACCELGATLIEFAKLAREAEEPKIITPPGIILPS